MRSIWRGTLFGARWPLALLIVSIGLTVLAVYESVRVGVSNQVVAEGVVHDYAEFAAWAYGRHLEQTLRDMARELLSPINHGDGMHMYPPVPPPSDLVHYLYYDERCKCHSPRWGPAPESIFAFSIRADTLAVAVNTHPRPSEGWEIDRALPVPVPTGMFTRYAPADRDHIVHTIRRMVHEAPDNEHGYTYLTLPLTMGPRMIAYTLMPTAWGDTLIYGVQYTPRSVASVFKGIMADNNLLPPSFGAGKYNRDIIDIVIRDGDGATLFTSSGAPPRDDLLGRTSMGPRFANLVVQAAIAPQQAGSLVVGGLPRSRLPFLLGVLLLAAALTVTALTLLRRESELSRVRAEWIASVSHELRTPLAQIRLFLDTVRLGRAPTPERRDWALAQVDRETTRLSHMIEKVLSFSRLGRGSEPDAQPCDIAREVEQIVGEFRTIAETRQVTIVTELLPVPVIPLRRDALRHMLLNLLDNAVKYGPAGQTVRVRVDRVGDTVALSVADEGPGVPLAERETVWRQFTRGKASAEQGGSGIGLSIVRELAAQHGGRAWVGAAASGGALFTVSLPIPGHAA
jgi:signal transduction histidine kinase